MRKMHDIKESISSLRTREMRKLDTWLRSLIEARDTALRARGTVKRREVLQTHETSRKTYRLEHVSCGKERCRCAAGKLHGPYWYAYWTEDGKTKSHYIGKKLPRGIKPRAEAPKPRARRASTNHQTHVHRPTGRKTA